MVQKKLIVRGAREHNLKNVNVEIPRDKLVVITGLSGSGKSSLAFDTIFAEGQRRYVESLSAYARQFLGQMEKPDVDQIEGLSPAVSIDQRGAGRNPRSTVGTVTEIYDYLRLLYARIGVPHCPVCGVEVERQSAQQIVERVEAMGTEAGRRVRILTPLVKDRKGHHQRLLEDVRKSGFVRVRVDGETREVEEDIRLDRYKMHTIEVVVDRLVIRRHADPDSEDANAARSRLTDSIETALELGDGVVIVNDVSADPPADHIYSEHLACPNGHGSLPELEPRTFSFNSPHGACPTCQGLGVKMELDPDLLVPNPDLTLSKGAIDRWAIGDKNGYRWQIMRAMCEAKNIPLDVPWREMSTPHRHMIMHGTGDEHYQVHYQRKDGRSGEFTTQYEGFIGNLARRYRETDSDYIRRKIEQYMSEQDCPDCEGRRLRAEALAVTVDGRPIDAITVMPVNELHAWLDALRGESDHNGSGPKLSERDLSIGHQILKEIGERVSFMVNVGLGYLTLSRSAASLSGGEAQRIRLATQIGSRLTGVLYVLDEPSIGLHQRDNARLLATLEGMRDLGNTLLVVEHDEETIRRADWIVDLGPGAGEHGGKVVAEGTPEAIMANPDSLTGAYLSGRLRIDTPAARRPGSGDALVIRGARAHNLKDIDVRIPLGKLICITGVSGSGKSTLLLEVLYKRLAQLLHGARDRPGDHDAIEGVDLLDKIIHIDQSPIGRTPRSNPATYTKTFDGIRALFSDLPESMVRGYKPGRFSFNVKGGRCEACKGQGQNVIEMQFLPDIYITCDVCHGTRYNRETLQIKYKGKSIADVLSMTVTEALDFFANIPKIVRPLKTLDAVGLGYIRLGQPATTLSGGEAQRIKLSRELSKRDTGQTLYVLDEPSVGLHAHDVAKLIDVLQTLVDKGNTIVIIEHQPDIIKVADHIIDLGPEGGDAGGRIIAEGTPEQVAAVEESHTGHFLCEYIPCAEGV